MSFTNTLTTEWILGGLYLVTNLFCLAAYWPQIWRVWRHKRARTEVVLITWWVWTVGGLTEWVYAGLVAHSMTWQVVAACHTVACFLVAFLATCEQWRLAEATRPTEVALPSPIRSLGS